MLTLKVLENISFKTPIAVISKAAGEILSVNNVQFALSLVDTGKAQLENDSIDMTELMQELIRIDHETDSALFLDERIAGSTFVLAAYQTGNKILFIEQVIQLIGLYVKCRQI
ncbi:MAG: hypothetical protein NT178_00915 [Proteobacteria bacterium]|nr:hypothetical protein [Pseudomonadota bacterium]